jgi:hypothetical protein
MGTTEIDNNFVWVVVVVCVASVFVFGVNTCSRYELRKNDQIIELVGKGASPIQAACAVRGVSMQDQLLCTNATTEK